MDNNNELQEFNLDDILSEFHEQPDGAEIAEDAVLPEELSGLDALLEDTPAAADPLPETTASGESTRIVDMIRELSATASGANSAPASEVSEAAEMTEAAETAEAAEASDAPEAPEAPAVPEEDTENSGLSAPEEISREEQPAEEEEVLPPPVIELNPKERLRELKRKLVAGPEKRYYELTSHGVVRLQTAILVNVILVGLCAALTAMFAMGAVSENRLRFVIFSQVLALMISALTGSNLLMDALGDLFKGKFTVNTLLGVTLLACSADAVLCLKDLRIPCCAAFSLEMAMALWARYEKRCTEINQMDTLRKAVRLRSITTEPDVYDGKAGIIRGDGCLEDFTENYARPSAPEKVQSVYALIALVLSIGIAAFAGLRHGTGMAVQIFSTTLLVAVPASFFISISRPMAILERRLHMVGTVLCGWQGVTRLCGKAVFPFRDEDLFPQGAIKLNGVKFYGDRDPIQVLSLSTSLICASNSILTPLFRQMNTSRGGSIHKAVSFRNYDNGGIGGEVRGEPVLLGTMDFLQNMGVEIPDGTMVNQAVYAAIDGQLCAVFALTYSRMRSATAGMVSICGSRKLTPVFTGGDFMLTESMLRSKFNIKSRRVVFPGREVREKLALRRSDPNTAALALVTREELVSYAYAVSGARSLRAATKLGVAIHLIGGILGLLIMLALAYLGSTQLLTPTNALLYQLVWLVPGLLVTEWTRAV